MNDGKTLVVKCNNDSVHNGSNKEPGEGNVLMFMRGDSIFLKCSDHHCKRWTRIYIKLPGCKINFSNAAFVQSLMPKNYHFDAKKAPVVIERAI